jgi:hypothetical protein
VIENRTMVQEIAQSLTKQLRQFLLSFNGDNSRWRTIEKVLDLLFYHVQVMECHAWKVISEHTNVYDTTLYFYKEGIWA